MQTSPSPERLLLIVGLASEVVAHDRRSGQIVWRTPLPDKNVRNMSLLVEEGRVIVATPTPALYCLDYATGRGLWQRALSTGPYSTPPQLLLDEGQLFVGHMGTFEVFTMEGHGLWAHKGDIVCAPGYAHAAFGLPGNVVQGWRSNS
jgi:outer membrane protein assembly factor BamB